MKEDNKQSVEEITSTCDSPSPTDEQELKKVLDVEVLDI